MGFLHLLRRIGAATAAITQSLPFRSTSEKLDLSRWIEMQKATFRDRDGVAAEMELKAKHLSQFPLGISGPLLDELVNRQPRLVPKEYWGGPGGWLSAKRETTWRTLLEQNGIGAATSNKGFLIRFLIDASEWVPHPYAPPHWAIQSYEKFSSYVVADEAAFRLCAQWANENSAQLTSRMASRLTNFPVQIAARYRCYDHTDYADVAVVLAPGAEDVLQISARWKGQAALAQLVTRLYPDAICEYGAPWLKDQRIDVFIPSIGVAIEYQGEQHYEAIDFFGGKSGLLETRLRDKRKAEACARAAVTLVEWRYSETISEEALRRKLQAAGPPLVGK